MWLILIWYLKSPGRDSPMPKLRSYRWQIQSKDVKTERKKKIIISEYFLKVTKQTHTRTALQNRDVRSLQSTSTEYKILFYQHDTKVLINGQMSVCKFFLSFCLPLFRNFAQQEKEALWQTSSFAVFRFSDFLPRSQNERQHDKVCSLSFGWFCREWKYRVSLKKRSLRDWNPRCSIRPQDGP